MGVIPPCKIGAPSMRPRVSLVLTPAHLRQDKPGKLMKSAGAKRSFGVSSSSSVAASSSQRSAMLPTARSSLRQLHQAAAYVHPGRS